MKRVVIAALFAGLLAGCGGSPTAEVSGSVELDGRPLVGARVQFIPTKDVNLGTLVATTGADGRFTVARDAADNPARPGAYTVLVSKPVDAAPGADSMAAPKDELADVYQDQNRSPLHVEVEPGPNALPPFAVSKAKSPR
jgi:hypothetical protein